MFWEHPRERERERERVNKRCVEKENEGVRLRASLKIIIERACRVRERQTKSERNIETGAKLDNRTTSCVEIKMINTSFLSHS